ncbi:hypothetical protein H5410_029995 [Solanum commersonii]|uniref:Uncharacterized protein n=1 Tax=Solanum commersonii TaxID=4109 RepID=A0A9J5YED2_SOLCO|nr:hypothetical protein H5410_029995 [Solanum commersonii]
MEVLLENDQFFMEVDDFVKRIYGEDEELKEEKWRRSSLKGNKNPSSKDIHLYLVVRGIAPSIRACQQWKVHDFDCLQPHKKKITYHDKATQTETEEEDTIEKIFKAITTLCTKVDSMDNEIQKLKTNEDNQV